MMSLTFNPSSDVIVNMHHIIESSQQPCQNQPSNIDYKSLQPNFGWLPADVIKLTFDNTTQFCCAPFGTHLKKHFRSPHPACNVEHHQEPIVTDTVHSDTPAIDNRAKVSQIFVGAVSGSLDVCGTKTKSEFVNIPQVVT